MVEAVASNVDQDTFFEAIELGFKEGQKVVEAMVEFRQIAGRPKRTFQLSELKAELQEEAIRRYSDQMLAILTDTTKTKVQSQRTVRPLKEKAIQELQEAFPMATADMIEGAFYRVSRYCLHEVVLNRKTRFDGRRFSDLRPMTCEVDLKQPLHGSCLFQRGETQVGLASTINGPKPIVV
jgi:polyribonucleotide nucleotidyltransferase